MISPLFLKPPFFKALPRRTPHFCANPRRLFHDFLLSHACLFVSAAVAQQPSSQENALKNSTVLPDIVVTATRTPIPFEQALADVTMLDEDAITKSGAASLADLLARQPGLEIARYGGPGAVASLFIRGTNSGHALILIDGVRTAALASGTSSLEAIPLAEIERIEILRGAASMLYGADALGGVVQIFTKKAAAGKPLSLAAETACGTDSTCTGNAQAAGTLGHFRWAIGAGAERSHGVNAIENPANDSYNPDRDGYRNEHQRASLQFAPNADHSITAAYLRDAMDAQIDSSPTNDDRTRTQFTQARLAGSHRLNPFWQTRWQLSEMHNDSRTLSWGDTYRYRSRERQYLWQNEFDIRHWLTGSTLLLAFERDEQQLDGSTDYDQDSRDTNAVTGGYRWQYEAHTLQLSGRYDHSSQYGGETTGGVSYGYRIAPAWQLTAGIANAYKAPTFNDLYYPDYSHPDLSPEKARTIEAGVRNTLRYGALTGEWRATLWNNRVHNLIVYTCNNAGMCRPENVNRAQLRGITLATDLDVHGYGLNASLDWQSPEDEDTGHQLPRRARVHGSATVSKTIGAFYSAVNLVASGKRYDDAANTTRLGGYGTINLIVEWTTPLADTATLTWFARIDNLFDKDYVLVADYATGGTQALIGVRGKW